MCPGELPPATRNGQPRADSRGVSREQTAEGILKSEGGALLLEFRHDAYPPGLGVLYDPRDISRRVEMLRIEGAGRGQVWVDFRDEGEGRNVDDVPCTKPRRQTSPQADGLEASQKKASGGGW